MDSTGHVKAIVKRPRGMPRKDQALVMRNEARPPLLGPGHCVHRLGYNGDRHP